ncbi:hypothetical protein [Spirosoma endophyticum]|uniref:Tetratricopeptide repeat-containing protein n=1 Tax=Spirosoma endophyticum TaxID=662367 RepID=A0A1I2HXK3_9BACT|nr:hypothetical protein [Spirosoma endophyticum]SFF34080.1 hypothetical protein SAMN05216167_15018 [Spirosoma endophyticum]
MNFLKRLFKKKPLPSTELAAPIAEEVTICLNRAAELRLSGQCKLAIIECDKVLFLHPNNHLAYHIRALAKYSIDDREGAIKDWKRSQSLREILK